MHCRTVSALVGPTAACFSSAMPNRRVGLARQGEEIAPEPEGTPGRRRNQREAPSTQRAQRQAQRNARKSKRESAEEAEYTIAARFAVLNNPMKILVAIKQVPARDSQLKIASSGRWIAEGDLTY